MTVSAIHTDRVTALSHSITDLIDQFVDRLERGSVLAVTSKIVALCEGRVRDPGTEDKHRLIEEEADAFLPRSSSRYDVSLTIKGGTLIPSSGVDESNAGGKIVLWPQDSEASADAIWTHLARRFDHTEFGVIITDSTTAPLRVGEMGIWIAHAGFAAVNSFVGTRDLFGRPFAMTQSDVANGLAAAAVAVMGEAAEQTPLAMLEDLPFVRFQNRIPTDEERAALIIDVEDDLYAPLLTAVQWQKGGGGAGEATR